MPHCDVDGCSWKRQQPVSAPMLLASSALFGVSSSTCNRYIFVSLHHGTSLGFPKELRRAVQCGYRATAALFQGAPRAPQ